MVRMMRIIFSALVLIAQTLAVSAPASAACSGADPALVSVRLASVMPEGGNKRYRFSGRVVNVGRSGQPSNTLQFVEIYDRGIKLDNRGIPPLRPGGSYTFGYDYLRSADAGDGTSKLTFVIHMRSPTGSAQNCSPNNDRYEVRF